MSPSAALLPGGNAPRGCRIFCRDRRGIFAL